MANMGKNVKDASLAVNIPIKDILLPSISYAKTNKLITALYIVTDIMDKEEPLRNKLRTLGTDVLSDMHSNFSLQASHLNKTTVRIAEIISFLNLAETLNLMSAMNSNILKNEFLELKNAILDKIRDPREAFEELLQDNESFALKDNNKSRPQRQKTIRLGVQKAGTFIQVLSDRVNTVSNTNILSDTRSDFEELKKQRRNEITKILKYYYNNSENSEGITITDIKDMAKKLRDSLSIYALLSCSEKTLQRELVSMVNDNVLSKTGSKRWSKYLLAR